MYKLASAPIEHSHQPAHLHGLIRVFNGRSTCSQGSNISSDGKLNFDPTVGMRDYILNGSWILDTRSVSVEYRTLKSLLIIIA